MLENQELIKASIELGKFLVQNTSQTIMDRKKLAKAKDSNEETVNSLEEIINSLIAEKNQLIEIAQIYDEHLVAQKISKEDIDYITNSILPLLESILEKDETDEGIKNKENLELLKPLLSAETFNILQLLGFNFKQAIGEPLTILINKLIISNAPDLSEKTKELEILNAKREIEYFKILQDEDAYNRLLKINNPD
ncbi:hypothetical protein FPQ10_10950 [Allobacillus sp. SKP2-8]|uniref:hypothetical protein n=1 Tax=unclassified Allobacillus TaxID=2628859 RepID=UPI0011829DEF|nr:hypothetical protein [Allobacillus sp. SKP2-8]TSJ63604.1 hypothetical protein FPQ10_10950 [Allobacillus sp. SKP2-8]